MPERFAHRKLYVHNPTVTLMRTTAGREPRARAARIAAQAQWRGLGPTALFVPLAGVSAIDADGQPFHDPEADDGPVRGAARGRRPKPVEVHELDADINDPAFAAAMADRLHELIQESR